MPTVSETPVTLRAFAAPADAASLRRADVTLWTAALFTALFALVAIAHLGQAIHGRRWFMLGTVFICCLTELLGVSSSHIGSGVNTAC